MPRSKEKVVKRERKADDTTELLKTLPPPTFLGVLGGGLGALLFVILGVFLRSANLDESWNARLECASYSTVHIRRNGQMPEDKLVAVSMCSNPFPNTTIQNLILQEQASMAFGDRQWIFHLREDHSVLHNLTQLADGLQEVIARDAEELFYIPLDAVGKKRSMPLRGRMVNISTLALSPRAFHIAGFASTIEVEKIMKAASTRLQPSQTFAHVKLKYRNSQSARLDDEDFPVISKIRKRAAALLALDSELRETVQVVQYDNDQYYNLHTDAHEADPIDVELSEINNPGTVGGRNRLATVLIYLNTLEELDGGATIFPFADKDKPKEWYSGRAEMVEWMKPHQDCLKGLRLRPKAGDALVFYNLDFKGHVNGTVDRASLHAGCRITSSNASKWIANLWWWNKPWRNPLSSADMLNREGNALVESNQLSQAEEVFKEAIRLHPSYVLAYHSLAEVFMRQRMAQEAQDAFGEVIRLAPDNGHGYLGLGKVNFAKGEFDLAERRFKLAARLDPKQLTFSAYLQLAKLYTVMKPPRLEKAVSAYETVLKVRPDHEGVKLEMVKVKDAITKSQRRRSKK